MTNKSRNATAKAQWMPCPAIKLMYPGLAYMKPLSELIIVKETDELHDLLGGNNTGYTIFNSVGQKVFLAVEKRRCRKFDITIFNHYGNEVIQVEKKPYKLFRNMALVWAPPGNFVGVVKEAKSCVNTFIVQDWYGKVVLDIRANGRCDLSYKINAADRPLGSVKNNWLAATILNVKNWGISFPETLNVMDKATLLGACFLIGCLKY